MNINIDKKRIEELEIALNHYVKGLTILKNNKGNDNWKNEIKRMTEHSLVEYGVIDIRQHNFLELTNIEFKGKYLCLIFSNECCKYATEIKKIEVKIPYLEVSNHSIEFEPNVKIKL